jgi:hypothetical protein
LREFLTDFFVVFGLQRKYKRLKIMS